MAKNKSSLQIIKIVAASVSGDGSKSKADDLQNSLDLCCIYVSLQYTAVLKCKDTFSYS